MSAQLGPGQARLGWGFYLPHVGVIPVVHDDRVLGVSIGVGADGLPLFLLLDGVSWRGGFLGVPSVAVEFAWVWFLAGSWQRCC